MPRIYERPVSRSLLAGWALKLVIVAVVIVVATQSLLPALLGLLARFLIPFIILYVLFRLVFPRRVTGRRHGMGFPVGFALWRAALGPPRAPAMGYATVTTFAGERDGRRRGYELTSRSAPMVEHGDVVRVIGVPLAGRVQVLMLRSPSGLMFRRGLFGRVAGLTVTVWIIVWLASR